MPKNAARLALDLAVAHADHDHVVGTWRNVFVCVWRHETHAAAVRNLKPVIEALKAENPRGIAMLTVLESGAAMPTAEARKELPTLFQDVAKGIACSGLVFEGEGFRAAAIRALTTTFNLVAAQPFPHKVFSGISGAETMFLELLPASAGGERLQRGEIVAVANAFRAQLHALETG